MPAEDTKTITGKVKRILFPRDNVVGETFAIAALEDGSIVKGHINNLLKVGYRFEFVGYWQETYRGPNFVVKEILASMPETKHGIVTWLHEMFPGIGPTTAREIYDKFNKDIYKILSGEKVTELCQVKGVGKKRAASMCQKYKSEIEAHSEIFVKFYEHKFTTWETTKIVTYFDEKGIDPWEGINSNPYIIVRDIEGIGFKKADAIATGKLGVKRTSPIRVKAAINYLLTVSQEMGHVYLLGEELTDWFKRTKTLTAPEIDSARVPKLLDELQVEGDIKLVDDRIYLKKLYDREKFCAKKLKELTYERPYTNGGLFENKLEADLGDLNEDQRPAVLKALANNCCIITGPPGSGKTFAVKRLLRMLIKNEKYLPSDIGLAAPTGKAAKVLKEYVQDEFPMIESKTVHRLLAYSPAGPGNDPWGYNKHNPLPYKIIVIDETSMMDINLLYFLIRAIPNDTRLIFLGDVDQLPSVGPGKVLIDMIKSNHIPYARLTKIVRQKEGSGIIHNAVNRINQGKLIEPNTSDFFYIRCGSEDEIIRKTVEYVTQTLPAAYGYDPKTDIQVIGPTKRGYTGTIKVNEILRDELKIQQGESVVFGDKTFTVGDKIVNTVNDYFRSDDKESKDPEVQSSLFREDVFNGYIGIVESVDPEKKSIIVDYGDAKRKYNYGNHTHLDYAYAMTVHRTQGSEYKCAVIVLSKAYHGLLRRNVLYTGVTRGKERVIIIGDQWTLEQCINNVYEEPRNTSLQELLSGDNDVSRADTARDYRAV